MPNFRAKNISLKPLPFSENGVEFKALAKGSNGINLLLCQCEGSEFFITLKPFDDKVVAKGEKISRPAQIGLLQKALIALKNSCASDVINEAIALKKTRILKQDPHIILASNLTQTIDLLGFKKLFVEIGFGSGRHLLFQAEQNPDTLVIGIEIYKPSLEQVAKLAKASNLNNIRLIDADARLVLALLKKASVDRIFLHFPVPWQKAPHRRVASKALAKECERVLKEGGSFELRTDEQEYCQYCLECFLSALNSPQISILKNQQLKITSKYEARWLRQEKDIFDLIYHHKAQAQNSQNKEDNYEFKFELKVNPKRLLDDFEPQTLLFDGYFFHLERVYDMDNKTLIRLSMGGFYAPEHCYLIASENDINYFIKTPLKTRENALAHKALEGFLNGKYN